MKSCLKITFTSRWCIVSCIALFSLTLSHANPILPPSTFGASNISGGPVGNCCPTLLNGVLPISTTIGIPGVPSASLTIEASGSADYGLLHASLTESLIDPSSQALVLSQVSSLWRDIWTISLGNLTGAGYLEMQYSVDGTLSSSGSGRDSPSLLTDVWSATTSVQSQSVGLSDGAHLVAMPSLYTFQYGVPFNIAAQLNMGSFLSGSGSISEDFSNTAILTGIEVFDSQMNPITGFSISSSSGTPYGPSGVVPEPASLSLILLGAGVLCASRFRPRRPF